MLYGRGGEEVCPGHTGGGAVVGVGVHGLRHVGVCLEAGVAYAGSLPLRPGAFSFARCVARGDLAFDRTREKDL